MGDPATAAALWGAVLLSGIYHGVNPAMGWPLAVSAALFERRGRALPRALLALSLGHFVAMAAMLLPFSMMVALVTWQGPIRLAAGALLVALGVWLLVNRAHPRFLARVPPNRLALWSFLAALAHGAGLMLVPVYLGLCGPEDGHAAAGTLMGGSIGIAIAVAAAHTLAMTLAGGVLAAVLYLWLGLKFLSRAWFNLDRLWALSLILVGAVAIAAPA